MNKRHLLKYFVFVLSFCLLCILILLVIGYFKVGQDKNESAFNIDSFLGNDEDAPPSPAIPALPQELSNQPKDTSALGGYNVLIADRGNNRIIEVTPDKQIVWEYDFKGLSPGFGADDAFFTDSGKTVIVNLEKYHIVEQIDYQTKKIIWQYGTPGVHGSKLNYLYSPDDAYKLPNGDVTVADIKNCRVIEISPDKQIVRQYGKTQQCSSKAGFLDAPNGDTPLQNGGMLISTILNHGLIELDSNWNPIFSMSFPLKYPSDPQLTKAGNILIAEYQHPGKIIEISKQGNVVWEYDGEGNTLLNKPSLAIELPNGNILSNDDLNHRVIVIDKQTKKIIWQYGVTGKPGNGAGQLNIPDGVDIIKSNATLVPSNQNLTLHTVGEVTRHALQFVGQNVLLKGYLLKKESGYIIFSDEPTGSISSYDLPVTGASIDLIQPKKLYLIEGTFLDHGLISSNGNKFHLKLTTAPKLD
jgi:hypothetical protein